MRTRWLLSLSLGVLLTSAWAGAAEQAGSAPEGLRVATGSWCPSGIAPASDSDCIVPPQMIHAGRVTYPELARRARFTGKVELEAVVSELGEVAGVRVLTPNPVFEAAAVEAVKKRVYKPAYQHGMPVPVRFPVTVRFGLDATEHPRSGPNSTADDVFVAIEEPRSIRGDVAAARDERSPSPGVRRSK